MRVTRLVRIPRMAGRLAKSAKSVVEGVLETMARTVVLVARMGRRTPLL